MLDFKLLHTETASKARRGRLELPHGIVETPVFMPVGTNATVKAVSADTLEKIGFKNFSVWFRCFNFVSMVAFK